MIAQSLFLQLREKVKSKGLSPFHSIYLLDYPLQKTGVWPIRMIVMVIIIIAQLFLLQLREKVKSKGLSPFQPISETIKLTKSQLLFNFKAKGSFSIYPPDYHQAQKAKQRSLFQSDFVHWGGRHV